MKPKHQRLLFVLASIGIMAGAATLLLKSFQDNLIFFYTPTQWLEKSQAPDFDTARAVRIGGLVEKGSVKSEKGSMRFTITDLTKTVDVAYRGMVPTLFREGQGVVAQGTFANGLLEASSILAKHDENYMPREVVEQLKKSGRWQDYGNYPTAEPAQ